MTLFRAMPTPLRFVLWFFLALLAEFAIGGLGVYLAAGAFKIYAILGLQIIFNLTLGWVFGLLRFQTWSQFTLSALIIVLAVTMRIIMIVPAIIITVLFCDHEACVG